MKSCSTYCVLAAVEFMWDNVIESMDKLRADDAGQGCILAHCMGLGKTLSVRSTSCLLIVLILWMDGKRVLLSIQVITLVHTLLSSDHTEQFTSCLVVCPLNTILNWQSEWKKWLEKRGRVPVKT